MDPRAYFIHIEIGNLALARGSRSEAWPHTEKRLKDAPPGHPDRPAIEEQVKRVKSLPLEKTPPLRDPFLE
jgi:hypothetical protein